MNKVLNKRILRDLKENFARYLALLLMIIAGMFIIIAIVGAAETIITGTTDLTEKNKIEDGQFSVFLPLTKEQEEEISENGVTIEKMFSADVKMDDGSTLRLMKKRENINLIHIDEGRLPEKEGEAVIEKRYSEEHDISLGDTAQICDRKLIVTGIGTVPEYDSPMNKLSDTAVESSLFGLIFVTEEEYENILSETEIVEEYCYAYRLNDAMTHDELKEKIKSLDFDYTKVEDKYFLETIEEITDRKEKIRDGVKDINDGAKELRDGISAMGFRETELYNGADELYDGTIELKKETDKLLDEFFEIEIDNLTSFIKAEDNPRILAAAIDLEMNKTIGLVAGVVIMILFTYVISVFVIHQIQRESSVIGTFYALGAKKKDLVLHYITLPTIICFIGGLIGSAIGFSDIGIVWQMKDSYNYFSIPDLKPLYPLYLIIYAVIMPPVISVIVNYIVISKRLSKTALSLIRNEQKIPKRSRLNLKGMGFISRFQIRQIIRELRTSVTVIFGMFICLLVFMLGMNCYILCQNIKTENSEDTKFGYMYTLKYPEKEVPENAEACYTESLSKKYMGNTLDVNIIGVDDENKYYPEISVKGKSSIAVSSSVAEKYNLSEGDKLILSDTANDMDYAFTVEEIVDYSVGLSVFMDIESMRELFLKEDDYYNMLLSEEELDIDMGRVYSVTTKADIEKSASVFVDQMRGMFTMMISMSIVIFCVVMYLMLNVMIDRASFGISLVKIFGFRTNEIRKLYLNGNAVTVALGAVITIPLSKVIMNSLYPYLISNTACGMNLKFPPVLYALIFIGIMIFYFVVSALLVRKIKKITPAEVLKNRE